MNLDLLKPFDLEDAKRGEEICWYDNGEFVTFIAEAGLDGNHVVRRGDGNLRYVKAMYLRMKPLAWVEDRPVYRGDVLYYTDPNFNQTIEVIGMNPRDGGKGIEGNVTYADKPLPNTGTAWAPIERWTWTKPEPIKRKVKMWQALLSDDIEFFASSYFFVNEGEARNRFESRFIQLLPHTEIEVEV